MVTVPVAGLFLGAVVLLALGLMIGLVIGREKGFNEGADYQAAVDEPLMCRTSAPQEGAQGWDG